MSLQLSMHRFALLGPRQSSLYEALASAFASMTEAESGGVDAGPVNTVSLVDVEALLTSLASSTSVPPRATDQLFQEVRREAPTGRVTFAQLCGASRR